MTTHEEDDFTQGFPGYRVEDFSQRDLSCPNIGGVCPGKLRMVSVAMDGISAEDIDSGRADQTRSMVCVKLAGYNALAKGFECIPGGPCEVRRAVADSSILQLALNGVEHAHPKWFQLKRRVTK